ncbi:MobF family relaxase [Granulicella tundricola]|uniref:Conjugative relaxase domain protein n=1 Tax=Granulicella tundricola (strain ATCC BAA-1859 / DSM 23138 / MP5ACTX9) TaxID=1198114 RepID=E8X1F0_GRATM|nr:MobF family relaxase [Granulicella tundricola]ADW70185.1 conjugative relaxase domain protein [Granulicella tundricola MP5ACTX9]
MLTISKAISSAQAQTYHKLEYTSDAQSYYKQDETVKGEWQGKLAASLGLSGEVAPLEFSRLTEGIHPQTEAQMVRHREGQEYTNADGSVTKPVQHRAGWDATFSAPKSVSLTALVGGDERVTEAHRAAVTTALEELEKYTHARIGGNNPAEVTGKFVAAKFEHDTARPVNGYAAPQLHTHAIIFNVTQREDGSTRAIQERTFFESQNYATAVYQSVLTHQLRKLGYEIEPGQSGAPQILGFTQAYLDASSPRSRQIKEQMERVGFQGPEAAQIAAHATRDRKQTLTPAEVLAAHKEMAKDFGDQPERVVADARERALTQAQEISVQPDSRGAVAFAKEKVFEREAVADERLIMREALRRGMGEVSFSDVQSEFQRRQAEGEFRSVQGQKYASGRSFTTPETIADERANVQHVLNGQGASAPMLSTAAAERQATSRDFLNEAQQTAIREVLTSTDRIHGFQGLAGTGKTSTLAAIREGAEQGNYKVEGFAPTSKAAGQLREAGIEANTLQSFLARQKAPDSSRHLYMLDESSLASTKQMRAFLEKIHPQDRVLVIGDTRQHQGVDAGRPFQQMQEAGMQTSKLDTIMRQKDPELLRAVQHLATNETEMGIALLTQQGRVTELANASERIAAIARDYAAKPENTLIVSPDNRSRQQINEAVRGELLKAGKLAEDGRQFLTLSHRSDMTGPDRTWAAMYRPGDVVQYERGSKAEGIERGSFGVVRSSDAATNRLTVELPNGVNVEYDPKRVYGVNVYRETSREFATGDRLQFSAIYKDLGISNRDMGTITRMEPDRLTVLMDGKEQRSVSFNPIEFRQFDHGYAVTSHSSQGLTTDRVIANIDTESSRSLINNRLAYVAISRASEDARIYTNDAATLGQRLATDVTKTAALDFTAKPEPRATQEASKARTVAVHEYKNSDSRLAAVATEYVSRPERSVIVALDRAEREQLTQLVRADLYAQGKLGRDAQAISVLIEKATGNKMRVDSYQPGEKIQYKTGSPGLNGIPHESQATVVSTTSRGNLLSIRFDATREEVSYNPGQLRTATRESRVYQEATREVAEGERVRFTRYDKDMGVRSGDLGTVTRIGEDHAMRVKMDSGKIAEVPPEKAQHIDYGYVVDSLKDVRAERVIATGDGLTQQAFQAASSKADLALYTSPPQQEFASSKEIAVTEFAQPTKQQNDFGIGF